MMYWLIALIAWPILSFIGAWFIRRMDGDPSLVDVEDIVFVTLIALAASVAWPVVAPFAIIVLILSVIFT